MLKRVKTIIVLLLGILFLFGIVYSLFRIITWEKDADVNNNIKEEIDKSISISVDGEESKYDIDWEVLKSKNSDTIAYLKVNNTNIDYIVVKGNDNDYYLKRNFNKEKNVAGWIFADYQNKFDGTDKNIVIYGHNRKEGTMFGNLKNVLDESWYNDSNNLTIDLVTEDGLKKYHVFSVYKIVREDYYINTEFSSDKEYLKFLNTLKERSINDFGIELSSDDKILTLSTCADEGAKRVVLHAVLEKKL